MKKMIRLTALAAAVIIISSCLFSCDILFGSDPAYMVKEADEVLESQPYTVLMSITYTSSDEGMAEAADSLLSPAVEIRVDKDDFYLDMTMSLHSRLSRYTYTAVDGVIYLESYEERDDEIITSKTKSTKSEDALTNLKDSLGGGASLCADDFSSLTVEEVDGVSVITCTDIKDSALSDIIDALQYKLTDINAMVLVNDVTLVLKIKNGRYISSETECTYDIATSSEVYTVTAESVLYFSYTDEFEITVPEGSDEYVNVPTA